MLFRRFGRPGLLGTMARTAVVAGTATAVVGGMQSHQQARAQAAEDAAESQAELQQMQNRVATMEAQQGVPAAAAPVEDDITKLEKLGEMNKAGLLSDAEFAAAKAKLLGM